MDWIRLYTTRLLIRRSGQLLKPGGIFRLVLTDLAFHVSQYLESTSRNSALEFMRTTGLGESSSVRRIKELVQELIGNSKHQLDVGLSYAH